MEVTKNVMEPKVDVIIRPKLPPRVLGVARDVVKTKTSGESIVKTGGVSAVVVDVANKAGRVILPADTDHQLSAFLGANMTKKKGHDAAVNYFETLWKTFHRADLSGSEDFWLERCDDDGERAKVWALFAKSLYNAGVRSKQIGKILSSVKHQFESNLKSTVFLEQALVTHMKKAVKPTTKEIREEGIKNAAVVKLPLPAEVTDRIHDQDWEGADWDWNGTLKRAISMATDLILVEGFRASNVVTPGPREEDHGVRYSDLVFVVRDGGRQRRVVVGPGLAEIDETSVVSVQSHVYSTKTGAVAGAKIPYTVTRDTELGNRLVSKMFQWTKKMVLSPLFDLNDHLCTVYREKGGQWHRRCTRRGDISTVLKTNAAAFDIPAQHISTSSLRKAVATNARLEGGDDDAVAGVGRWAKNKSGRSSVAETHYDLSRVTGRKRTSGGGGLTEQEVQNMVPLHPAPVAKKPTVQKPKAVRVTSLKPKPKGSGVWRGKLNLAISPKKFNVKKQV